MSTPTGDSPADTSSITIERAGEWFVATDERTGVASQGETRSSALSNLADAIELHEGGGEPIDDPDAFLREELDIDVDELDEQEPPWLE